MENESILVLSVLSVITYTLHTAIHYDFIHDSSKWKSEPLLQLIAADPVLRPVTVCLVSAPEPIVCSVCVRVGTSSMLGGV